MTFSIEQLGEIDKVIGQWCVARVPPELKSQIDHDYEIDGQAVRGLKLDEAVGKMRGEVGAPIKLKMQRGCLPE